MQNKNISKTIKKSTSKIGSSVVRRKNRTLEDGNTEGSANDHAVFESEFHLLTKNLGSIPLWQINLLRGTNDQYMSDALKMIDTEEKQLQAISDLWQIIKAQPKYKTLKEPNLSAQDSPSQVLQYILKKLGALANGLEWNIDIYSEGRKLRYQFVVKKYYPNHQVRGNAHFMALDFLPALEIKDKQLHDIIIEIVALVSKKAFVPLWDEDGDYSAAEKYLWSNVEKEYSSSRIIANYEHYTHGKPPEYLKKINSRKKVATQHSVYAACKGYNWKSDRQRQIAYWMRLGMRLAEAKDCIENHTYIPEFDTEKERCITPYRNYKFIWSNHNNDLVNARASKCWKDDDKRFGKYRPISFTITKPGEKMQPIKVSQFPIMLDEFLGLGEYYFQRKYEQYFYKDTLRKTYSPWEI